MTCRAGIALYVIPGSCTLSRNWPTTFLVFIILNVCSLNPSVCLSLSEKSISYRCFSFIRCMLELPRTIYSRARDQWVKTTLTKWWFLGNINISHLRSQDASPRHSNSSISYADASVYIINIIFWTHANPLCVFVNIPCRWGLFLESHFWNKLVWPQLISLMPVHEISRSFSIWLAEQV